MSEKKKPSIFIVATLVASLLLAIPLAGCEGEISFTTASLSEVTMCLSVDEEGRPVSTTALFATDAPEIYTSAKLSNAPPDTEVKLKWIYIKGEADVSDYLIDETSRITEGSGYFSGSLTRPADGWPRGDYKVVWYVDGKEKLSLYFTVNFTAE